MSDQGVSITFCTLRVIFFSSLFFNIQSLRITRFLSEFSGSAFIFTPLNNLSFIRKLCHLVVHLSLQISDEYAHQHRWGDCGVHWWPSGGGYFLPFFPQSSNHSFLCVKSLLSSPAEVRSFDGGPCWKATVLIPVDSQQGNPADAAFVNQLPLASPTRRQRELFYRWASRDRVSGSLLSPFLGA